MFGETWYCMNQLHKLVSSTLMDVPIFFDILLYYYICMFVYHILYPLRFSLLLVLSLYKEEYLKVFKRVSVWLHSCCGKWEGWALVNRLSPTSGSTVVAQTDRPKSIRNRCVIEVFGGVFVLWVRSLPFSLTLVWEGIHEEKTIKRIFFLATWE